MVFDCSLSTGVFPDQLKDNAGIFSNYRLVSVIPYLLYHTITTEETQPRLTSRRPFATSGKDLLSTSLPNETKSHWIARVWSAEWQPSTSRLREYCLTIQVLPRIWPSTTRMGILNKLCIGVGRFNADMWRWGLPKSPACDCGADQQIANHIITECPSIVLQMVSMAWSMLMQM